MKYLLSAAALTAAAAVIGIASANQAHQPPSIDAIKAARAQARRNEAAAQACGGSAWEMQGAVLTCHKEIEQ